MSAEKSSQSRFSMQKYIMHDETLDRALSRLFHGRCAFCESERPTTAYRFRPVEEAAPSKAVSRTYANRSHLYYAWLANAWRNIYSICDECRPKEAYFFPVERRRTDRKSTRLNSSH